MSRRHFAWICWTLVISLQASLPLRASALDALAGRFEQPELGLNMHLSAAGLFGLVGGSLVIAPLPYLVFEPGIAQRIDEEPRLVGLVRARVIRKRAVALSFGLGLDRERNYEAFSLCGLGDDYKCGTFARNVWRVPLHASVEIRLRSGITIQPHVGLKIPVAWDRCQTYSGGEVTGKCFPSVRPYFGISFGWSTSIGSRASTGVAP